MKIDVPYGQGHVVVEVPGERVSGVFVPNDVHAENEAALIQSALSKPIGTPSYERFLAQHERILCIVNDGTRPTPTAKLLDVMAQEGGLEKLDFIIATGCHRAPTADEYQLIFGHHYEAVKERVFVHDARDDANMVHIGTSRMGTEMRINRRGMEAKAFLILGSVEPHYFAGYTGGRKAFLPGIAAYATIEQNHKYALRMEAQSLALDDNPVHLDMVDALKEIEKRPIFSVQVVLNQHHQIVGVTAGDIHRSFDAAIARAHEVFCVPMKEKVDVVVSAAPYPMDVDLYQSQKALDNGKLALKDGGTLILVSKCRTGVGEDSFLKLLRTCDTPGAVIKEIEKGYKLGYHKAAKMAEIATWATVQGYTDLDGDVLRTAFIEPVQDLQAAVLAALEKHGPGSRVAFLPAGSITVPKLG